MKNRGFEGQLSTDLCRVIGEVAVHLPESRQFDVPRSVRRKEMDRLGTMIEQFSTRLGMIHFRSEGQTREVEREGLIQLVEDLSSDVQRTRMSQRQTDGGGEHEQTIAQSTAAIAKKDSAANLFLSTRQRLRREFFLLFFAEIEEEKQGDDDDHQNHRSEKNKQSLSRQKQNHFHYRFLHLLWNMGQIRLHVEIEESASLPDATG